jgi:branched-chain amino acid transport system permease protein
VILIWSFAYTGWSIMGRFGLVSLGHGAFMAVGGYVTALLWNELGLTPWIGIPVAMACSAGLAVLVGYPCFRFRIVGHYFALVTLALSEVVRQVIIATRDTTGGSLGYTPERHGEGWSIIALQFDDRVVFYFIAVGVWLAGIIIWYTVDRSMSRYALEAISEDEDASAAVGVQVTKEKLKVTMLSAVMTAFAGAMYCQYQMFISPDTIGGVGISLQIVFAVVVGGIYNALGPTIGAVITILLAEVLRIWIGTASVCISDKICLNAAGVPLLIYGIMLILFIIFLPKGIAGGIADKLRGLNNNRAAAK